MGRPTLRATDDFFDHGANSMFTLQLVARLDPGLSTTVHPDSVLSNPTARGLAATLRPGQSAAPAALGHLVRRPTRAEQLLQSVGRELVARLVEQPRILRRIRAGRERVVRRPPPPGRGDLARGRRDPPTQPGLIAVRGALARVSFPSGR